MRYAFKARLLSWAAILVWAVCCFAPAPMMAQSQHGNSSSHDWTYSGDSGPAHWADLSPDFTPCAIGKLESPIDISHAHRAELPPIQFSYLGSPLKIVDNGHTIQVNYAQGSTITIGDNTYQLVQFHFHHPSEEELNGKKYPMELHLVHKDKNGKLAVVAVLIEEGKTNKLINMLWDNLPTKKDQEVSIDHDIDATELLPSNHQYYTFPGSLTTPPCSEGVTWYVLQTPISLSKAQIDKFASEYPMNARPVQPLHGRVVQESK